MILFLLVDMKYSIVKNKDDDSHVTQNITNNPASLVEPLLNRNSDSQLLANAISNINYGTSVSMNSQNDSMDPVNS